MPPELNPYIQSKIQKKNVFGCENKYKLFVKSLFVTTLKNPIFPEQKSEEE